MGGGGGQDVKMEGSNIKKEGDRTPLTTMRWYILI